MGIDDPQIMQGRKIKQIITLSDRALASSGNYRKYRVDSLTGKKFVHTVDPRNGLYQRSGIFRGVRSGRELYAGRWLCPAFMAMDLEAKANFGGRMIPRSLYRIPRSVRGNPRVHDCRVLKVVLQQDMLIRPYLRPSGIISPLAKRKFSISWGRYLWCSQWAWIRKTRTL